MTERPMSTGESFGMGFFTGSMLMIFISLAMFTPAVEKESRQRGIKYCVEQPQKCKIEYDYFKIKEGQTK